MNLEAVSQITFSEFLSVPATRTIDRVSAKSPFGALYAPRAAAVLCTAYLAAHLEGLCIEELRRYVAEEDLILGAALNVRQCNPARAGEAIEVRGVVIGIGDHEATFSVEARTGQHIVADGEIRLVAVSRDAFMRGLAALRAAPHDARQARVALA